MKPVEYVVQLIILLHLSIVGLFKPEVAERARRMLFLTSLATTLSREGIIKTNTLDNLNKSLHLANNDSCLEIGEHISSSIWKYNKNYKSTFKDGWDNGTCIDVGEYLSLDDIREISPKVIDASPTWLRYNGLKMQQDVTDLFITHAVLKKIVY